MEKKSSYLLSLAALGLLVACECPNEDLSISNDETITVTDEALSGSAADFIANAGDRVFFAFDKSSISPEAEATLVRQVAWLKAHPSFGVLIEGHCDEIGTREYNLGLGERRADSVAKFLTANGIDGARIRVVSYGKDRPIAVNGTQDEVNRLNRVSISVVERQG